MKENILEILLILMILLMELCSDIPATGNSNWNGDIPDNATSMAPWRIYNIGNNQPIKLMKYIDALEKL